MTATTSSPDRRSAEFSGQVAGMFDRVAPRYDAINSLMTAGLHHRWRERAVEVAGIGPGEEVLDVCCGTGDLSLEAARRVAPGGSVRGCDFSGEMLARARAKAGRAGLGAIDFEQADALALPYADRSFDAVTVGFGLRNLADHAAGIAEMARVARPGGRVVVLEFTRPRRLPFSAFYDLWFDRAVPLLGRLSPDASAYGYLPASVREYPGPREVAAMFGATGLVGIRWWVLAGGIVTIHLGVRA